MEAMDVRTTNPNQLFVDGIIAAFEQWTALELAIHNEWGGPQSAQKGRDLCNLVIELFSKPKRVYKDVKKA
jgi:pre-rRNA-processing protein TSR2